MDTTQIGLYGGTFDPIHHGHLIVARSILEQLDLESMIFVPSAQPPHKEAERLSPFERRAAMVELATRDEPGFTTDRCEGARQGPSYTLLTVEHFSRHFGPHGQLVWVIGADSLAELDTWHRVDRLVAACRLVTAGRPGWQTPNLERLQGLIGAQAVEQLRRDILPTPLCEIASRDIRARVAAGSSIRYLVPETVRGYIAAQGLYQEGST